MFPWIEEWLIKIYFFVRPMLKWLLRKVTGKCELLRITYGQFDGAERTIHIENSLKISSDADLKRLVTQWNFNIEETVKSIMTKKAIVPDVHMEFEGKLSDCLTRIRAYNKILADAEALRQTKFSSDDTEHEDHLSEMWSLWKDEPLPSRIGEHWTDIGFQGHDPKTDFRGMGMLGLQQLIFFAREYPAEAKQVLSLSHHPKLWFSLAIVSINLTEMGYDMLEKRHLRSHFYRLNKQEPDLYDFNKVHSYLLFEFTQFWIAENPKDIMEFSRLRKKFKKKVKSRLREPNSILSSSFQKRNS